jgi:hypothetical protein
VSIWKADIPHKPWMAPVVRVNNPRGDVPDTAMSAESTSTTLVAIGIVLLVGAVLIAALMFASWFNDGSVTRKR